MAATLSFHPFFSQTAPRPFSSRINNTDPCPSGTSNKCSCSVSYDLEPYAYRAMAAGHMLARRYGGSLLKKGFSTRSAGHRIPRFDRARTVALAAWKQEVLWAEAPLVVVERAAESLYHVVLDISDNPELMTGHTKPGQFVQVKVGDSRPTFLAIASPPVTASTGSLEFLIKYVEGSTAGLLCNLGKGDTVELSQVLGNGFDIEQISPPEKYSTVLLFATGSGIRFLYPTPYAFDFPSFSSEYYGIYNEGTLVFINLGNMEPGCLCNVWFTPVIVLRVPVSSTASRIPAVALKPFSSSKELSCTSALIAWEFCALTADMQPTNRFQFAHFWSPEWMLIRDLISDFITERFKEWESSGVKVFPVLSQPDNDWMGERGYVQAAFAKAKQILKPLGTGAVLCGHKQMTEESQSPRRSQGKANVPCYERVQ
eukprot:Gb_38340 [translate_table: standard]